MSLKRLVKRSGPSDAKPSGGDLTPTVVTASSNGSAVTTASSGGKSPEDIIKGEIANIYNKREIVIVRFYLLKCCNILNCLYRIS